jgi:putative restriction endonuclease
MPPDRLRSIVPMFGGGTRYVETLDAILAFVEAHQPTTDELVGWHRGSFQNVSSRDSIMRRVSYLQQAGFLRQTNDYWELSDAGRDYTLRHD